MVGNTASTPSEPAWLNTKTAAERLGITPRTLYRLVDEGLVVGYKVGRVIRFQEADIEAALEGFRIRPGELRHLYQES